MKYRVTLSSVGNPDVRQDPARPLYGCESNRLVPCNTFKEASRLCREFINNNDLGGGNWSGGKVYDNKMKQVARISYNGRIWDMEGKEIV